MELPAEEETIALRPIGSFGATFHRWPGLLYCQGQLVESNDTLASNLPQLRQLVCSNTPTERIVGIVTEKLLL